MGTRWISSKEHILGAAMIKEGLADKEGHADSILVRWKDPSQYISSKKVRP